jgi:hypothetical protein
MAGESHDQLAMVPDDHEDCDTQSVHPVTTRALQSMVDENFPAGKHVGR